MQYPPNFSGADKNKVDPLLAKKVSDSGLIEEIEFRAGAQDEVSKAVCLQATNDRRPY